MTDSIRSVFTIESEATPQGRTIRPVGELDIAAVEQFGDALAQATHSDAPAVLLDLGAVTFIDSAGVRSILQAVAASQANANKLRVGRAVSEPVARLFELIGATDRLPYA